MLAAVEDDIAKCNRIIARQPWKAASDHNAAAVSEPAIRIIRQQIEEQSTAAERAQAIALAARNDLQLLDRLKDALGLASPALNEVRSLEKQADEARRAVQAGDVVEVRIRAAKSVAERTVQQRTAERDRFLVEQANPAAQRIRLNRDMAEAIRRNDPEILACRSLKEARQRIHERRCRELQERRRQREAEQLSAEQEFSLPAPPQPR